MKTLFLLPCLCVLSSAAAMASPALPPQPGDWIERMIANHSSAIASPTAGPTDQADWVDRMVAARSWQLASSVSLWQISRVEAVFSEACSTKDVDKMMSLFARNATLTAGGKTYTGADQIRAYWGQTGAFLPQNHWAIFTPAHKSSIQLEQDRATLHFECLWVDAATGQIRAHSYADDTLVRKGEAWVIEDMKSRAAQEI